MQHSNLTLTVADIGGTNGRFAVASIEPGGRNVQLHHMRSYSNADVDSLAELVERKESSEEELSEAMVAPGEIAEAREELNELIEAADCGSDRLLLLVVTVCGSAATCFSCTCLITGVL